MKTSLRRRQLSNQRPELSKRGNHVDTYVVWDYFRQRKEQVGACLCKKQTARRPACLGVKELGKGWREERLVRRVRGGEVGFVGPGMPGWLSLLFWPKWEGCSAARYELLYQRLTMIAMHWEQIIRWQGQKQGAELGGNYNNPGMRRWYLTPYCAFCAAYIVHRDQCKGTISVYFSVSAFSPCGSNLTWKGKGNRWHPSPCFGHYCKNINLMRGWRFMVSKHSYICRHI